jgi:hypothetical protein
MESKRTNKKGGAPTRKLYGRGKGKPIDIYKEERKVSGNIVPSVDANSLTRFIRFYG